MKTTTEYIQRLTIETDDDGNRTVTRTSRADTATEYLFGELSPEAQERAIRDAIEEEKKGYYYTGDPYASHTGIDIAEVWNAYKDFAKHQPVRYHDHYTSFYLTVEDAERVTPEEDNGICWSMDICSAWNQYAAAVPLLIEEAEEHEARANEITAPYYWPYCVAPEKPESARIWFAAHEDYADRCRAKAEELAEQAKDAVENCIQGLIDGLEDYYTSPEFWREWLADGETRFTRDGERI